MGGAERRSRVAAAAFGARVALFGCEINALSLEQTVTLAATIVRCGIPVRHCVVNAAKMVAMRDDPELRRIVLECPIVNADGQAVVWAARLLGTPLPERVAGIDLFHALRQWAADAGHPVTSSGRRPRCSAMPSPAPSSVSRIVGRALVPRCSRARDTTGARPRHACVRLRRHRPAASQRRGRRPAAFQSPAAGGRCPCGAPGGRRTAPALAWDRSRCRRPASPGSPGS